MGAVSVCVCSVCVCGYALHVVYIKCTAQRIHTFTIHVSLEFVIRIILRT